MIYLKKPHKFKYFSVCKNVNLTQPITTPGQNYINTNTYIKFMNWQRQKPRPNQRPDNYFEPTPITRPNMRHKTKDQEQNNTQYPPIPQLRPRQILTKTKPGQGQNSK